jgi:hypothetical protein
MSGLVRLSTLVVAVGLSSCPATRQTSVMQRSTEAPAPAPAPVAARVAAVLQEPSPAESEELASERRQAPPDPTPEQLAELTRDLLAGVPAKDESADNPQIEEPSHGAVPSSGSRDALDPSLTLAALGRETLVFAQPSYRSRRLGYLRAGAIVTRAAEAAGFERCREGWYRVAPEGYVCVGRAATLDVDQPLVRATRRRPDRLAPLPYPYARSRHPTPHFYTKLPSVEQQQQTELAGVLRAAAHDRAWNGAPYEPVPEFLAAGKLAPLPWGFPRAPNALETGRALPDAGFALLAFYEHQGRGFAYSTDFSLMPLDRLTPVEPSDFRGLALGDEITLPVAFVRSRAAHLYRADAAGGLRLERRLVFREALPITDRKKRIGSLTLVETTDGAFVRADDVIRIDPMQRVPSWAKPGRSWIDVSILEQSLVAYEGTRAVYVTLVSTGVDGLGDPDKTHSTVRGRFLIHTKHLTATMSSDELGDEYDLRDVPYVQYFERGYALHAAYWHDGFGKPRSHGCINLSPLDARWLFHWTDPPVPEKWHGALSLRDGTLLSIHP